MPSTQDPAGEWQFYVCNDGIVPKRAASAELSDILHKYVFNWPGTWG